MKTLVMALLGAALWAPAALAHPLAPGLLELAEVAPARYAVHWRTSIARAGSARVEPRLPPECTQVSAPDPRVVSGEALVARWVVACEGGLVGRALGVDGLAGSGINVIVRVLGREGGEGGEFKALLGADQPSVIVTPVTTPVFPRYLRLGAEHLLAGIDHLLFLVALLLLVTGLRRLVVTVTAFTIGHTVTLSLATMGLLPFSQALAEALIAATLLVVALQIQKRGQVHFSAENGPDPFFDPFFAKNGPDPFIPFIPGIFGLIHGLGFAGALREAGLPAQDLPLALFAFNLGIELAQLAVVALLAGAALAWRRLRAAPRLAPAVPAYVTGSLAVCWLLERSAGLLA